MSPESSATRNPFSFLETPARGRELQTKPQYRSSGLGGLDSCSCAGQRARPTRTVELAHKTSPALAGRSGLDELNRQSRLRPGDLESDYGTFEIDYGTFEIVGAVAREFNLALTGTQDAKAACKKAQDASVAILKKGGHLA